MIDPKQLEEAVRHFLTEDGYRCSFGELKHDELAVAAWHGRYACAAHVAELGPKSVDLPQTRLVELLSEGK
jgi:hypothetical protein